MAKKLTPVQTAQNAERARIGEALVKHRQWCQGEDANATIYEENIIDAITEIFHFAAAKGFNVGSIGHSAHMHLEAELLGED